MDCFVAGWLLIKSGYQLQESIEVMCESFETTTPSSMLFSFAKAPTRENLKFQRSKRYLNVLSGLSRKLLVI